MTPPRPPLDLSTAFLSSSALNIFQPSDTSQSLLHHQSSPLLRSATSPIEHTTIHGKEYIRGNCVCLDLYLCSSSAPSKINRDLITKISHCHKAQSPNCRHRRAQPWRPHTMQRRIKPSTIPTEANSLRSMFLLLLRRSYLQELSSRVRSSV